MSNPNEERIAIRAFARHIGVTDTYVKKQMFDPVKNPKGALKECICRNDLNGRPMLYKEMALTEWVAAGLTIKDKDVLAKLVPLINQPQDPLWKEEGPVATTGTAGTPPPVTNGSIKNGNTIVPLTDAGNVIHAGMDAYTAKAFKEIFAAGKLELEYRQKLGKLVEKDAVYKLLFEFGQEVRTTMLQIPARIVTQLLACDSEREASELLRSEIENALTLLSRGPKKTTADEDEPISEEVSN